MSISNETQKERKERFIKFLEEIKIKDKFISLCEENRTIDGMVKDLPPMLYIDCNFEWDKTEDGVEYWRDVYDQWLAICANEKLYMYEKTRKFFDMFIKFLESEKRLGAYKNIIASGKLGDKPIDNLLFMMSEMKSPMNWLACMFKWDENEIEGEEKWSELEGKWQALAAIEQLKTVME